MTPEEFNEKWEPFLERGFLGLEFGDETLVRWLDRRFVEFSKRENFTYAQIKLKFGFCRFYCTGVTDQEVREVERFVDDYKV